jgi:hypothetical protein
MEMVTVLEISSVNPEVQEIPPEFLAGISADLTKFFNLNDAAPSLNGGSRNSEPPPTIEINTIFDRCEGTLLSRRNHIHPIKYCNFLNQYCFGFSF